MAKRMSFSAFGATFGESHWVLAEAHVSPIDRTGSLAFHGYVDRAAFEAGEPPVGRKTYDIGPAEYDAFFEATGLAEAAVFAPVWQFAALMKEGPPPDDGEEDDRVGFFESATDV